MSRELPPNPSLEHLKSQAKDRLPALRRDDPAVQLTLAVTGDDQRVVLEKASQFKGRARR